MPKFKKKPVVVDAVHFVGINMGKAFFTDEDVFDTNETGGFYTPQDERCPEWLQVAAAKGGNSDGGLIIRSSHGASWGGQDTLELFVKTLEGEMLVSPNDWLIRGVKGELYPCKADIFAVTYSPATAKDAAS